MPIVAQAQLRAFADHWRLRAPGHADRWAECLTDPWHEYAGIRPLNQA